MAEISYRRHRFPPVIIQHAVWLYLRFTLSYRDVEELDRAATLDMKAKALSGAKVAEEDPNIAVAMAAAAGTVANATVADRLAALQQRK
jgi:hypothetical protein